MFYYFLRLCLLFQNMFERTLHELKGKRVGAVIAWLEMVLFQKRSFKVCLLRFSFVNILKRFIAFKLVKPV